MKLLFVWNNFETQLFLFLLLQMHSINAQIIFFIFYQHIFATKTLQTTLANTFLVIIFHFMKHKSAKIFNIHRVWFIIIKKKQQIHWIFKFFFRKINWKNQFIFRTKYVNANIYLFNLFKILFFYRKLKSTIIKFFSNFFVDFFIFPGCYLEGLICLTRHHKKHWFLFLMLISPFLGCFNSIGKSR